MVYGGAAAIHHKIHLLKPELGGDINILQTLRRGYAALETSRILMV